MKPAHKRTDTDVTEYSIRMSLDGKVANVKFTRTEYFKVGDLIEALEQLASDLTDEHMLEEPLCDH